MAHQTNTASWLILVDEDHLDKIHEVKRALEQKGLKNSQVVDDLGGTIRGSIAPEKVAALRALEGVEDIVPEGKKSIASPHSPAR
jgi:hypothetical protein